MLKKIATRLPPSITFLFLFVIVNGQDTIQIHDNTPIESLANNINNGELIINSKDLRFPFAHGNSIFRFLSFPSKPISKVKFKHCSLSVQGENLPTVLEKLLSKNIEFDSCQLYCVNLARLSGEILFVASKIRTLVFDSLENCSLRFVANPSFNFGIIQNSRNLKVDIQSTDFKDSAQLRIFNSSIQQFDYFPSDKSGLTVEFRNDTLKGSFGGGGMFEDSFFIDQGKRHLFKNNFDFHSCYIDGDFIFFQEIPNSTFTFENCTFGPNAYLGYFWASRVNFINCLNMPVQIPVGINSRNLEALVSIINTDVDKLRMNFTDSMRLVFDSFYSKDAIHNSYERLLTKYKNEGKPDSYKNLDIQFQQYKNSAFEDFLERNWWYYGYRKYYVWRWTFAFLGIFFILNCIWWRQMHRTYPVITDHNKKTKKNKAIAILREAIVILVFTVYVFLSLRISLDKLKFDKIRYVVLFFCQYSVGLWCLFFIFRAILKI
jgi:hypothetical protein